MTDNTITVKAFADLTTIIPAVSLFSVQEGDTVAAVLARIGLPEDKAAIIFVNNRHAELDTLLFSGDRLSVFPPLGGG